MFGGKMNDTLNGRGGGGIRRPKGDGVINLRWLERGYSPSRIRGVGWGTMRCKRQKSNTSSATETNESVLLISANRPWTLGLDGNSTVTPAEEGATTQFDSIPFEDRQGTRALRGKENLRLWATNKRGPVKLLINLGLLGWGQRSAQGAGGRGCSHQPPTTAGIGRSILRLMPYRSRETTEVGRKGKKGAL